MSGNMVVVFNKIKLSIFGQVKTLYAIFCVLPLIAVAEESQDICDAQMSERSLVIIGASYAQGWSVNSIAAYRVSNTGIEGNQSSEMRSRFKIDVLDRDPQAVIIWGFINDFFRSSPADFDKAIRRIKRNYQEMIEEAERNSLRIIVATEVTVREPGGFTNWLAGVVGNLRGKESYQAQINFQVIETNLWLREFARSKNILVLDFQRVLSNENGWRKQEYATPDGSHLTTSAYDALTTYSAKLIQPEC